MVLNTQNKILYKRQIHLNCIYIAINEIFIISSMP